VGSKHFKDEYPATGTTIDLGVTNDYQSGN